MRFRLQVAGLLGALLSPLPVAAQETSTGVVRVNPRLRAVVVDEAYVRVDDGAVTLPCGVHKIKAGMGSARVVDVPCGGDVAVKELGDIRVPTRRRSVGGAGRLHGGLGQRRLLDDSVLGADLTASLGFYVDSVTFYFDAQVLVAKLDGLDFGQYRVGPSVDFDAFWRVRLGLGISVGGTTLTNPVTDTPLSAFSAGARIFGSVDVWRPSERAAFYVLGQLSVDSAGPFLPRESRDYVPAKTLFGPTFAVGARF